MIGILIFELFVIAFTIGLWIFMSKKGYKKVSRKFIVLFVGALLFEIMSEPMWINSKLSSWAFLYKDISWVLTLGWVSIIMFSILLVDYEFRKLPEKKRFWLYLLVIEAITVPLETVLFTVGIRGYAPELLARTSGFLIPFTTMPVEGVIVIPIFISLIITFYKYVNYLIDKK